MQLFITDEFDIKKDVIITEKRIINQLRKVLRAKSGYVFYLQTKTPKNNFNIRYKVEVLEIKDKVIGKILSEEKFDLSKIRKKGVVTGILNKFDKMELVVQKLTEIGIYEIIFAPFQRSVFKDIKATKLERFYKIMLEAAEQSWAKFLPNIEIYSSLSEIKGKKAVLDFDGEYYKKVNFDDIDYIFVGPEGGITEKDLQDIKPDLAVNFGQKVLRAETASILGGFVLM